MSGASRRRRRQRRLPPLRVRELVEGLARFAVAHGAEGIAVTRRMGSWRVTAQRGGQPVCLACGVEIDLSIVLPPRGLHRLNGRQDPIGLSVCPRCVPPTREDRQRGAA